MRFRAVAHHQNHNANDDRNQCIPAWRAAAPSGKHHAACTFGKDPRPIAGVIWKTHCFSPFSRSIGCGRRGRNAFWIALSRHFNRIKPGQFCRFRCAQHAQPFENQGHHITRDKAQHKEKKRKEAAKEAEKLAAQNKVRLGSNLVQDKNYKSDPGLSAIGRAQYTGPGMAFEARNTGTGRGPK